jgi:hypothetical protein
MGRAHQGAAACGEAAMEIARERQQRDAAQPLQQQRLRVAIGLAKGGVHGLLHEATRVVLAVPDGQEFRCAHRFVNVAQGDVRQRTRKHPATAMALGRSDEACVAQAPHQPPDHHRIGLHGAGEPIRRGGLPQLGHVQQAMEDARKATVTFHATIIVA